MGEHTSAALRWAPPVLWAGLIFSLSAQSGSRLPSGYNLWAHLAAYAILGVLVWLALGGTESGWKGVVLAIALASAYGITDEFHQSFVPQRTPDPLDWLADTVGAAIGTVVAFYAARRMARSRQAGPRRKTPGG